jgi:hypothetical protein
VLYLDFYFYLRVEVEVEFMSRKVLTTAQVITDKMNTIINTETDMIMTTMIMGASIMNTEEKAITVVENSMVEAEVEVIKAVVDIINFKLPSILL